MGETASAQAAAPRLLFDPAVAGCEKQLVPHGQVTAAVVSDGSASGTGAVAVTIKAGTPAYSGAYFMPAEGTPWDLSAYGHIEASVTNTGAKKIAIAMNVENEGDWHTGPWNVEMITMEPGQTVTAKVVFGCSFGFRPAFALNTAAVRRVYFFMAKTDEDVTFRVEGLQAAGTPDEKSRIAAAAAPKADPSLTAVKPPQGVVFGPETQVDPATQFAAKGGAQGALADGGKALQLDFPAAKEGTVTFKPASGLWNLNEALQVTVKVKNTGTTPVLPEVCVESFRYGGPTPFVAAAAPLAPNDEAEIVVPFTAAVPFRGIEDPDQESPAVKKSWGGQPGTGTAYRSNATSGVSVRVKGSPGDKRLQVLSITAGLPGLDLPAWLGQKPPVEGDWVQTLDEHFPGDSLDYKRWNVHTWGPMPTDKRVHATKDNVIVKGGQMTLRIEKKPGHTNDDPSTGVTDYATGYADTFGKWTQRYGYFEARVRLPKQPCIWTAFWLMPDRGAKFNHVGTRSFVGNRGYTEGSGMEFDIIESLSIWGNQAYNIAMHWDGYGATHKAVGTGYNYAQADKDGFLVAGLLWTPGEAVYYVNGRETARWKSPRISDVPCYILFDTVTGGWQTEPLDDAQLPSDYVVDYVRAWQRKDLASPEDGPQPNKGDLDAFHEEVPAS